MFGADVVSSAGRMGGEGLCVAADVSRGCINFLGCMIDMHVHDSIMVVSRVNLGVTGEGTHING